MPILFLMVVLKIPVALLLYLVWWAFRAETTALDYSITMPPLTFSVWPVM